MVWFSGEPCLSRSSRSRLVRKGKISPRAIEDMWRSADYTVKKVVSMVG